jgi:hypothetical protein
MDGKMSFKTCEHQNWLVAHNISVENYYYYYYYYYGEEAGKIFVKFAANQKALSDFHNIKGKI